MKGGSIDAGVHVHPELPSGREDVDAPVLVAADEDSEGSRRLGELVDLFPECFDLLPFGLQGRDELVVLAGGLGDLALCLEEPLLEDLHLTRGAVQTATEEGDLVLQELHVRLEFVDLLLVLLDLLSGIHSLLGHGAASLSREYT